MRLANRMNTQSILRVSNAHLTLRLGKKGRFSKVSLVLRVSSIVVSKFNSNVDGGSSPCL